MRRKLQLERLEMRAMLDGAAGEDGAYTRLADTQPAPNFQLLDANPNSPRAAQSVSPRDYVDKISAWYFIHST